MTQPILRYPVLAYCALAVGISWACIVLVVGPGAFPASQQRLAAVGPILYLAPLPGPAIAAIVLTWLTSGSSGLRQLWSKLLDWPAELRWYAVALFTAPCITFVVSFGLSGASSDFLPALFTAAEPGTLLASGLAAGLTVGALEELGWTGFAVPRLRARWSVLSTGLVIGAVWGLWHFPLFWEPGSFSGALPVGLLLARLFSWLPAYRVLMVWVHERTGSLPVAILMHAALVLSQTTLAPRGNSELFVLTYILAWAALSWTAAAVLVLLGRRGFGRSPARAAAADHLR